MRVADNFSSKNTQHISWLPGLNISTISYAEIAEYKRCSKKKIITRKEKAGSIKILEK